MGLLCATWIAAGAQRLPGGVKPVHYALTITPDLAKARFAGSERIEVVLDRPTKTITLNAAEIEFVSVQGWVGTNANAGILRSAQNDKLSGGDASRATNANAGVLPLRAARFGRDDGSARGWQNPQGGAGRAANTNTGVLRFAQDDGGGGNGVEGGQDAVVTVDAVREQATLMFARELPAGAVTLEIAYTGIMNDKLRGFYLSKTKTRSYGVTQFESTDARRAFPSFDEPGLKATFDISLVVDAGDTAISNMKMVSDRAGPVEGKHTVAFATTPKMSTYLVAWLVGDFECSEGKSEGVKIRACASPDKVKLTPFAVEAAKRDLKYYDKYFGIKYPLKKLDMVAIPDFESGAMENFGCITFRETELLVDEKDGTLAAKKEVASTVAHEMAHQWFGDLVTPAWWDDLWLNEGFATWMETKVPALWQPKWGYDEDAAVDLNHTLDEDSGKTTRPVRQKAETPAEINALFDDIAYGKAGAVIAMVEHWVGEDTFRKGVQAYLTAHLYGNATGEDFWDAETRVSGLPVDKVMRSFVEQPGVPLVTIGDAAKDPTHDGETVMNGAPSVSWSGSAEQVTQSRFFLSGSSPDAKQAWTIPVCFTGALCGLLTPGLAAMDVPPILSGTRFEYANAKDKGYYRTAYTRDELGAIEANAESKLTPAERIGLLSDEWALMQAKGSHQGSVGDFLDLVLAVKQDTNATVLDGALDKVDGIRARIATDADRERLDAVVRRELGPVYAAMGGAQKHESDDHADLRVTLFEALGEAEDPAVMAEAESMTKQLFAGEKSADPVLGDAAVALATEKGDTAMYEKLLQVSRATSDPDMKEAALRALTRFDAPELVMRTLLYAVSDQVRNQDTWVLITPLLARRATQDLAWEYVMQHWAAIEQKATASSGLRIVEATSAFCTVERRDEVASFFAAHRVEGDDRALAKSIDSINDCIRLREAQEPALRKWLDGRAN